MGNTESTATNQAKNVTYITNAQGEEIKVSFSKSEIQLSTLEIDASGQIGIDAQLALGFKCSVDTKASGEARLKFQKTLFNSSVIVRSGAVHKFERSVSDAKEYMSVMTSSGRLICSNYLILTNRSFVVRNGIHSQNQANRIDSNETRIANAQDEEIIVGFSSSEIQLSQVESKLGGSSNVRAGSGISQKRVEAGVNISGKAKLTFDRVAFESRVIVAPKEVHRYERLNSQEYMTVMTISGRLICANYLILANRSFVVHEGIYSSMKGSSDLFEDKDGFDHVAKRQNIYVENGPTSESKEGINETRIANAQNEEIIVGFHSSATELNEVTADVDAEASVGAEAKAEAKLKTEDVTNLAAQLAFGFKISAAAKLKADSSLRYSIVQFSSRVILQPGAVHTYERIATSDHMTIITNSGRMICSNYPIMANKSFIVCDGIYSPKHSSSSPFLDERSNDHYAAIPDAVMAYLGHDFKNDIEITNGLDKEVTIGISKAPIEWGFADLKDKLTGLLLVASVPVVVMTGGLIIPLLSTFGKDKIKMDRVEKMWMNDKLFDLKTTLSPGQVLKYKPEQLKAYMSYKNSCFNYLIKSNRAYFFSDGKKFIKNQA